MCVCVCKNQKKPPQNPQRLNKMKKPTKYIATDISTARKNTCKGVNSLRRILDLHNSYSALNWRCRKH